MKIGRFAPWYRWFEYAAFGRALERQRYRYLGRLAQARSILVLGEGDGRALACLLSVAPEAKIDVVELSGEMIALARGRVAHSSRVRFLQADALREPWPSTLYDGVVTLFFLDCFNEADLYTVIQKASGAMAPGARWLVSDFALPESGWRHLHARIWIWAMYRFFSIATELRTRKLPPIQTYLEDAGLQRLEWKNERAGLISSEVWANIPTRNPSLAVV